MSTETDTPGMLDPDSENARLRQELKAKDIELKRVTMARDAYEKMIEMAEETSAIPIRKTQMPSSYIPDTGDLHLQGEYWALIFFYWPLFFFTGLS